jgi:hypothetical protein
MSRPSRPSPTRVLGLLGLSLVLAAGGVERAEAAGFYIGDIGARGTSRGGAFVARSDSLIGIHYNPAGLAAMRRGFHVEGDLNLVQFGGSFLRKCPCVDPALADAAELDAELSRTFGSEPVTNQRGLQDIPFIGAGWGFDWMDLTLALAVWGPQGARRYSYEEGGPRAGPQRYSSRGVEVAEAYYALGVALSPLKGLRVGGTAHLYGFETVQDLTLWANSRILSTPEDREYDIPTRLDFSRAAALNWSLGASYDITDKLTIGGSVLGKRSVRADGTADIAVPQLLKDLAQVEVTGSQIELELNLPPIFRLGLEWREPELFSVEVAGVVEGWEVYDSARIRSKDVQISQMGTAAPLAPITIPYEFQNTYSVRVGGQFDKFNPWLGLRAGYFYEKSAIPAVRKDVSTPDLDKHGLALGVATTWYGVTLELAAQYIIQLELEVSDSGQKVVGPLPPPAGSERLLTAVGNGTYSGDYLILGASLSFSLDALADDGKDAPR